MVTITALRLDAVDMAVADILGANMLDIGIIAPVDLAYAAGFVLSSVSSRHLVTASVVAIMNLLVTVALRLQRKHKTFNVISWYGPILIGLFVFAAYALFSAGTGLR